MRAASRRQRTPATSAGLSKTGSTFMKKQTIILAALVAAAAARADQQGNAYVTVAAGMSHLSIDCRGAASCDKNDTGGKAAGGYRFGNGFGLEVGYVNFGKGHGGDPVFATTIKPDALTLSGVFALPLSNEWGMNFRLGAARVKTKVDSVLGTVSGPTESETVTKPYAGVGLTYAVSPAVKLELAVDSTQGKAAGQTGSLRLVSIGATFGF
ncbi:MAG: hypothetical protein EOP35_22495 [Rubrivivax sp.]|nr:MAG: hypothetical protein EOP35_22495 [Rubrivivax sp.]